MNATSTVEAEEQLDIRVGMTLAQLRREVVLKTYRWSGGNQQRTAAVLGISRATVARTLREILGVEIEHEI